MAAVPGENTEKFHKSNGYTTPRMADTH